MLIVDDNTTTRRFLVETLTNWNLCPTAVDSGASALDVLAQAQHRDIPFPLLLIDAQMPGMDGFTLIERLRQCGSALGATIMMLTPMRQQGDAARCRMLGVNSVVSKPVTHVSLVEAIKTVLSPPLSVTESRPALHHSANGREPAPLYILLAEDNAVNQKLAVRLLEKRGHRVVVAGTGREALASWQKERFDLILMDVQMPEMDGFEVTAAIRQEEAGRGTHTPIIAMTAHAMAGDRQRCLEAGMDGYVAKPIQPDTVLEVINGVLAATRPA